MGDEYWCLWFKSNIACVCWGSPRTWPWDKTPNEIVYPGCDSRKLWYKGGKIRHPISSVGTELTPTGEIWKLMWNLLRVLLRERQELPIVLVQGLTWGHSLFSTWDRMDSNLQGKPSSKERQTLAWEVWLAGATKIHGIWMGHQLYLQTSSSQNTSVFVVPALNPPFFYSLLSEQI